MRQPGPPRRSGTGTAWLVPGRGKDDYLCLWFAGKGEHRLVEEARASSADAAVSWGRARTPKVRIRTTRARTYWAGTDPMPFGFAEVWRPEADLRPDPGAPMP